MSGTPTAGREFRPLDDYLTAIGKAVGQLEWNEAERLCVEAAEAYPRTAQTVMRVLTAARA